MAGYVRGLKAFGNWGAAERLAEGHALRSLRRPHAPHKLIEPLSDEVLHPAHQSGMGFRRPRWLTS